jgi:citrate synthase
MSATSPIIFEAPINKAPTIGADGFPGSPGDGAADAEPGARLLDSLAEIVTKKNRIATELYHTFNVKRGLRNADGSGVLVGLTNISEVHGYVIDDDEKKPVEGRLWYRGIGIEDLVAGFQSDHRFGYEETVYLLIFGQLPDRRQVGRFTDYLAAKRDLPDEFLENIILKAPSPDIMNKLARAVLASYSYDKNPDDTGVRNVLRQCLEMIARFPAMVAYAYQAKRHYYDDDSLFIHRPQPQLSTAENILYLTRSDSAYTPLEAEILDLCLVLHAEHGGGNNSAFAVHVVSSSDTDSYSAVAAAIGSLKGPRHGGANIKVLRMMQDIREHVADIGDEKQLRDYCLRILQKKAFDRAGLLYGMGHAVYTISDPRTTILKEKAADLAREKGRMDEFRLYNRIEKIAAGLLKEKTGKPAPTNADFFSGFVYEMLAIPSELYTPLFAVSRLAGWTAHRIEELVSGKRIMRPAYKSLSEKRDYLPLSDR